MIENSVMNYLFDDDTNNSIIDFCNRVNNSSADVYIIMARKAACFIRFLEKYQYVDFKGKVVTDRLLDFDTKWLQDKSVVVIDDVIVSGTTIYTTIKKLESAGTNSIQVIVLGVNKDYFNPTLFDYTNDLGVPKNYITTPYLLLSDAGCVRMCSNIVAVFSLDISPYDVDFPQHNQVTLSKHCFEQIILNNEWTSYDVSSDLQSENSIKNITFLPTTEIIKKFDSSIGFSIAKNGFFKIRVFAKFNENKKKPYTVNVVPYFLFNEITEEDILLLYGKIIGNDNSNNSTIAKIRILQYIFSKKLFDIWTESVNRLLKKKILWTIDYYSIQRIIPNIFFDRLLYIFNSKEPLLDEKIEILNIGPIIITDETDFKVHKKQKGLVLQQKLVELFTDLYYNKEIESRKIVKKYGRSAFDMPEYTEVINRLKHGYSYQDMLQLIIEYSDVYDIETTVSLFIDEAIDSGVIVPIIAEKINNTFGRYFFRAYRHGEDVPFGELQEKMCAVLLSNYAAAGGDKALSKIRVEKLLVLFIRIGLFQKMFRPSPQDSIYYNVNIDAYKFGSITTIQDKSSTRRTHFIKYRSEASWLTDLLTEKNILLKDQNNSIIGVADPIDLPLDHATTGKIAAIGKIFARLYLNSIDKNNPYLTDDDFVLLSSCTFPNDTLNALAAELAIFSDRWKQKKRLILNSFRLESAKILELKANDIYISINSGQDKFFKFMNQEGAKRINQIRDQLYTNTDYEFMGTAWDQFWPENLEWSPQTLSNSLYYLIINEGYMLVVLNLLCRLLFLCVETDQVQIGIWKQQIEEYKNKIKSHWFKDKMNPTPFLQLCDRVDSALVKNNTYDCCMSIYQEISDLNTSIISILGDVELIIDRHGKPSQIIRYAHSLFLDIPQSQFESIRDYLYEKFSSLNIQYQFFPIAEPNEYFPEAGIWIFLQRKVSINQLERLISDIYKNNKKFNILGCKIFYNLSDELRLKTNSECGAKRFFGYFNTYSHDLISQLHSHIKEEAPITYWILENAKANKKALSELGNILYNDFSIVNKSTIEISIYRKISTAVITTVPVSQLEKFRREYKSMKQCTLFISYAVETDEHLAKIKKIVDRLKSEGFIVFFYEDAPLGTDMIRFMRKIESCDIALIIGSPSYLQKAMEKPESGVSFEDGIFSDIYQSDNREKIVPVAFGTMKNAIPVPFNKLKGMQFSEFPTRTEMDSFVAALINKHKNNLSKN